ncbi:TetR/AcrR family transcriptional regulator [Brucella intermedia]|uniref:TetR/AcrR family transcriptional regulator n=1 Tax=Brucella intermedia TaxID=94625 RepID=UPI00224AF1B5|nr:TetR family transcriptional regulator [Brucella intermedia]
MRRTREQAAETNRQILQAAEELFLEKGYDNVSLEEIAVQAGVSRGAVHWHFKNKQGLLRALRGMAQEPFRKLEEELAVSDGLTSLRKLIGAIGDFFKRLENDPRQQGLIRAMMRLDLAVAENENNTEPATFPEEMQEIFMRIFQVVDRDLGMIPPWNPEKAATMLNATVGGTIMEWGFKRGQFHLSEDGILVVRTLLQGLIRTL